jgi:hypothetical protein
LPVSASIFCQRPLTDGSVAAEPETAPSTRNPARKEAITLLLGCCDNELSIREPTQHFGPNRVHQSSIEIAVDQRQHIGKAAKLVPNLFPFSSEWHQLSKQTSNDLFEGLILRLRLTISVCALPRSKKSECRLSTGFPPQLADCARSRVARTAHR